MPSEKGIVRLINPITFLKLGLQIPNPAIKILLWTVGLDAITMANRSEEFSKRLCNLLGAKSWVFPVADQCGQPRQPKYFVEDVATDLFELRSEIAHGRRINPKFKETTGFVMEDGSRIGGGGLGPREFLYQDVLRECAVFLLCRALKRIFMSNLRDDVADEVRWRQLLKNPVILKP